VRAGGGAALRRRVLVTATGNAAEVFPRGHPGREGPRLLGRSWNRMQHYTAHVTWPRRLAAHMTARRDVWRCGATIETVGQMGGEAFCQDLHPDPISHISQTPFPTCRGSGRGHAKSFSHRHFTVPSHGRVTQIDVTPSLRTPHLLYCLE
jgi:hypothetical protein